MTPTCGTAAAYEHHTRTGSTPCASCRRANADRKRAHRRRNASTIRIRTVMLAELYLLAPPLVQVRLEHEYGTSTLDAYVARYDQVDA